MPKCIGCDGRIDTDLELKTCCMRISVKMEAKEAYSSVVDCRTKTFHYWWWGVSWVSEEGGEKRGPL